MKIVVFGPDKRTGVLKNDQVVDISGAYAKYLLETETSGQPDDVPSDLGQFIEGGDHTLACAEKAMDHLSGSAADDKGSDGSTIVCAAQDTQLHAPITERARIACAGGNFADHAAAMAARSGGDVQAFVGEAHQHIRDTGIWGFWKVLRDYVAPGGEIVYPKRCKRLDYEGELAIVLGRRGKDIPAGEIKDYIWGVTLIGDWSARMTAAGTAADSAPLDDDGVPINDTFLNPGDTVEIRSPGIGTLSASIISA
jgi:2-keto-4-pentenoate hydratase/2-oxohepta-3-ene-1,7-dioic acid hydratase in catechol pathway